MKISKLFELSQGHMGLIDVKVSGVLKFKIVRNCRKIDEILDIVRETLRGVKQGSKEEKEIFDNNVDIELDTFTYSELEPLNISARTLILLEEVTKNEKAEENV